MTNDNSLDVALTFDLRFWAPAYATMRSIALTTRRRQDLVFHLCHPSLPTEVIADLDRIADEFGSRIVHHDLEADANYMHFAATLPHTKYISAVTYARLLLAEIVGPDVHRIVYIDSDILVRHPIENLLAEDLKGRPMGGVKEPHALVFANGRDVRKWRDLLDPADPFFNAGLLLIDLDAWRSIDMPATLFRLEKEGKLKHLINDQQILNHLFQRNWTEVDRGWNTLAATRAIEVLDPKAVHYTGLNKPWNLVSFLPFARAYRHVMTNEFYYRYMRQRWAWYWQGVGRKLLGRKA